MYGWFHQLVQQLDTALALSLPERQLRFQVALLHMQIHAEGLSNEWQRMIAHFVKVTQSYAPHLFFCYQVPDLPRTNNDLEQTFGSVRYHERRATGRCGALPGLVVHGMVRLQAAVLSHLQFFTADDLIPFDLSTWHEIRAQISFRQEARRKHYRFRKDPALFLAALEEKLIKESLRS